MNNRKEEFEVPLTEDLMREHGILNRILLIYEEVIKRIENNTDFPIDALSDAVNITKSFIEDHHEKLEEVYVFPLFEKHKKETQLIKTLKDQHTKGRKITEQLQKLSAISKLDELARKSIKNLLQKFIRMYRPHEAREDTALFPQVRSLINQKEFLELSKKFEELEHEAFGRDGIEMITKQIGDIEKELNIYRLELFTPTQI